MGEAKRRKELGLPPRERTIELSLPVLDREKIQKKLDLFHTKIQLFHFFFMDL